MSSHSSGPPRKRIRQIAGQCQLSFQKPSGQAGKNTGGWHVLQVLLRKYVLLTPHVGVGLVRCNPVHHCIWIIKYMYSVDFSYSPACVRPMYLYVGLLLAPIHAWTALHNMFPSFSIRCRFIFSVTPAILHHLHSPSLHYLSLYTYNHQASL